MTWTQRLKRVFDVDVEICDQCGSTARLLAWVIACIEDPAVIKKIRDYLDSKATSSQRALAPESRVLPRSGLRN